MRSIPDVVGTRQTNRLAYVALFGSVLRRDQYLLRLCQLVITQSTKCDRFGWPPPPGERVGVRGFAYVARS